ncbi:hypothetical protein PPYC1_19430 [Paenibacillus polymyxa]|nr:hypothetical protein PPYC1_19430 [Paenibacillus polymyxa]OMF47110.1 hypothetical protein BK135_11440 [Paenibacillus peoriae]
MCFHRIDLIEIILIMIISFKQNLFYGNFSHLVNNKLFRKNKMVFAGRESPNEGMFMEQWAQQIRQALNFVMS